MTDLKNQINDIDSYIGVETVILGRSHSGKTTVMASLLCKLVKKFQAEATETLFTVYSTDYGTEILRIMASLGVDVTSGAYPMCKFLFAGSHGQGGLADIEGVPYAHVPYRITNRVIIDDGAEIHANHLPEGVTYLRTAIDFTSRHDPKAKFDLSRISGKRFIVIHGIFVNNDSNRGEFRCRLLVRKHEPKEELLFAGPNTRIELEKPNLADPALRAPRFDIVFNGVAITIQPGLLLTTDNEDPEWLAGAFQNVLREVDKTGYYSVETFEEKEFTKSRSHKVIPLFSNFKHSRAIKI